MRARDLFFALWVPSLFMEKVMNDQEWHLFCPDKCPGLADCYGEDFKTLYDKYVAKGSHSRSSLEPETYGIKFSIVKWRLERPICCTKTQPTKKATRKNIGVIKSSNLCTEIIEYSD